MWALCEHTLSRVVRCEIISRWDVVLVRVVGERWTGKRGTPAESYQLLTDKPTEKNQEETYFSEETRGGGLQSPFQDDARIC